MRTVGIILAGGSGSRVGSKIPKQFIRVGNEEIFEISLKKFISCELIESIIIVAKKDHIERIKKIVREKKYKKISQVIEGGETRQLSVREGILSAGNKFDNILIHDSARPFLSVNLIEQIIGKLKSENAVIPVLRISDTVVEVDNKGYVSRIANRDILKRIQTPQGFRANIIAGAHIRAYDLNETDFPDDSSIVTRFNLANVICIEGEETNTKITYTEDIPKE